MAELSLKQIVDKLNQELTGNTRKIVFWYDDNAEFSEDIDSLELTEAKIHRLEKDNQFYTKHLLERVDTTSHYLIYAPFPRPHVRDNHLEDMIRYSKEFFANRISLIMMELGINPEHRDLLQKHNLFFKAKDRIRRFYDFKIDRYSHEIIQIALMGSLCKTKTASFDEVMRTILGDGDLHDNEYLAEFAKYDLVDSFWEICRRHFDYLDSNPTLEKLVITLFVTYTDRYLDGDVPKEWQQFLSSKSGNVIIFLDSLMNNVQYQKRYGELSHHVASALNAEKALQAHGKGLEALIDTSSFEVIDQLIIAWIIERLLHEDMSAHLAEITIPELCQRRLKEHFGVKFGCQYRLLESAYHVISSSTYKGVNDLKLAIEKYVSEDYKIDQQYRSFYYHYDQLQHRSAFEDLRDLVEKIYTNRYLSASVLSWNEAYQRDDFSTRLAIQKSFYNRYVDASDDRVVVIISDALRFEVGKSLFMKLDDDPKCTPIIDSLIATLPTYTRLGIATLFPHSSLEITEDGKVSVDGLPSGSSKQREVLLKRYKPASRCIQFDDLHKMKKMELREVFTGMDVVYVFHNRIDTIAEHLTTENDIFFACHETIEEIFNFIKRISSNANTHHFIVTADHGFIYKRDKLEETDKIIHDAGQNSYLDRRYILSDAPLEGDGIISYPLKKILGNQDTRWVSVPMSSFVFKVAGGRQNYVHGGASPQEMIIPVIDVKVEKGRMETTNAEIALVTMVGKITNLVTYLNFIQTEAVSDVVKSTRYRVAFESEDGVVVSNEHFHMADNREEDASKRISRVKFELQNRQYDRAKPYYLVAYDTQTNRELIRHSVVMDIAFADDFVFDK